MKKYLLTVLIIVSLSRIYSEPIKIAVQERIYNRYIESLDGRDPLKLNSFFDFDRDIVEIIILVKAIDRASIGSIEFHSLPTIKRIMKETENGLYDIIGNTGWGSESKDYSLLETVEMIDIGEFEVGVYILEGREELYNKNTLKDIRDLTFVSSKQWVVDWNTLTNLKIKNVLDNPLWKGMISMIHGGRADALLAPFQSREDLKIIYDRGNLLPIPGIKIGLSDYRSFFITDKRDDSKEILNKLNRELLKMKREGYIKRAYSECGFYNRSVEDWKTLN